MNRNWEVKAQTILNDDFDLQEHCDKATVELLANLVAVMRHRLANNWAGLAERKALAALDTHMVKKRKERRNGLSATITPTQKETK